MGRELKNARGQKRDPLRRATEVLVAWGREGQLEERGQN